MCCALLTEERASSGVDGAVDTTAAQHRRVGGVDDGIELQTRDVDLVDRDAAVQRSGWRCDSPSLGGEELASGVEVSDGGDLGEGDGCFRHVGGWLFASCIQGCRRSFSGGEVLRRVQLLREDLDRLLAAKRQYGLLE